MIIFVGGHDERLDALLFERRSRNVMDECAADAATTKVGVCPDLLKTRHFSFTKKTEIRDRALPDERTIPITDALVDERALVFYLSLLEFLVCFEFKTFMTTTHLNLKHRRPIRLRLDASYLNLSIDVRRRVHFVGQQRHVVFHHVTGIEKCFDLADVVVAYIPTEQDVPNLRVMRELAREQFRPTPFVALCGRVFKHQQIAAVVTRIGRCLNT